MHGMRFLSSIPPVQRGAEGRRSTPTCSYKALLSGRSAAARRLPIAEISCAESGKLGY